MNDLVLKPSYWASVSGGKDSLFMLYFILNNLDKYKLDGVVHFELEIDYPFIKNVVNLMEIECLKRNIKFVRIKPRTSWQELYNKYYFPTRVYRWCNSKYKLDAKKQLVEFMKSLGYNVDYVDNIVRTKYLKQLNDIILNYQTSLFDFIDVLPIKKR